MDSDINKRKVIKKFTAVAAQCHVGEGAYYIIPNDVIGNFNEAGTFVVGVCLNESYAIGRRSVKPWGDGRWFMEITKIQREKAGIMPSDLTVITFKTVPKTPPELLEALDSAKLIPRWQNITKAQQRAFSEEIFSAKKEKTCLKKIENVITYLKGKYECTP